MSDEQYLTQARFASQAQTLLDKSDKTLLRCLEHGITPSAELLAYRVALRQVVVGTLSTIPTIPAYQVGT